MLGTLRREVAYMESEVRIVSLHIPILPATGATESGKTREQRF